MNAWGIRPEEEDLECTQHLELVDLENIFRNNPDAIVINNDSLATDGLADNVVKAIYSNCDGELGFVPTCQCGYTRGVTRVGLTCSKCGTVCSSKFVNSLEHRVWIAFSEELPPVLHPIWYIILEGFTRVGKVKESSLINFLLDPWLEKSTKSATLPADFNIYFKGRGFDYFYENIDEIMDTILYKYPKTAKKKEKANSIKELYDKYKHLMFVRHVPILHSSLHPETSNKGSLKYIDSTSTNVLATATDLSVLVNSIHNKIIPHYRLHHKIYKIYKQITLYYELLLTKKLGAKPGLLRKHVYAARWNWTFRAVVHAQALPGALDEIIMPWGIMVIVLKLPILNFLQNRYGLHANEALDKWNRALAVYDEEVDKCIESFIAEAKDGRIPVIMGRNPTIAYGSIMLVYVKKYTKDPHDETIGINACIVKPLNMDFDGDETYGAVIWEKDMEEALSPIHPSELLFSVEEPGLSSRIKLIDQHWVMLENYAQEDPNIDYYEEVQ